MNQTAATRRAPLARPRLKWGWLEVFMLVQFLLPTLLFIPGLSALRLATRIGAFAIAPMIWVLLLRSGVRRPGAESFPARGWLFGCMGALVLGLLHPDTNSFSSGMGQIMLYLSIMSPVFWVAWVVTSPRQISRMMAMLFLLNALSATLGVAQVYRPSTFNPPVIPAFKSEFAKLVLSYTADDGTEIIRPCGLGDTPGGASGPGAMACLMGLAWALRPLPTWRRGACLGLAFLGCAVIYFSHVRALLLMLILCICALAGLLFVQKNYAKATSLIVGGILLVGGSLAWTARKAGGAILERFGSLLEKDPVSLYQDSRGGFVQHALTDAIWDWPLGAGLGRWGQIYEYFGDHSRPMIWVEVQWPAWIIDGGAPLLVLYVMAVIVAMRDSLRIARTTPDADLRYWAAVILASNLSIVAATFAQTPFLAPLGVQFWLLSCALHAADRRLRDQVQARRRVLAMAAAPAPGAPAP